MKVAWIDTETGGVDHKTDALLQIAIEIFIDDVPKESDVFHVAPFNNDRINDEALEVNGFTRDQVETFTSPMIVKMRLENILGKYVNKFNPLDKFVFAGYGARFDMDFMRQFFKKNDDNYFGSYFFSMPLDVMSFVAEGIVVGTVKPMKSFKLVKVCDQLGIELGEEAHDAMADIRATRELYDKLKRG